MTPKLRRWIDLLAALLRRNYPAPLEELRAEVPGYPDGKDARRRAFERDKSELCAFGIQIETRFIVCPARRRAGGTRAPWPPS